MRAHVFYTKLVARRTTFFIGYLLTLASIVNSPPARAQTIPNVNGDHWSGVGAEANNAPFTIGNVNWVFEVDATFTVPTYVLPVNNGNNGLCSSTYSPAQYYSSEWVGLGGAGDPLKIYTQNGVSHGDYLYQVGLIYEVNCPSPNATPTIVNVQPFYEIIRLAPPFMSPQDTPSLGKISPGDTISIRLWINEFGFGNGPYQCVAFGCATWMHYTINDSTTKVDLAEQVVQNPDVVNGTCPQYYWGCVPTQSGEVVLERDANADFPQDYYETPNYKPFTPTVIHYNGGRVIESNGTVDITSATYNVFASEVGLAWYTLPFSQGATDQKGATTCSGIGDQWSTCSIPITFSTIDDECDNAQGENTPNTQSQVDVLWETEIYPSYYNALAGNYYCGPPGGGSLAPGKSFWRQYQISSLLRAAREYRRALLLSLPKARNGYGLDLGKVEPGMAYVMGMTHTPPPYGLNMRTHN